jgi:hypothetical protein
MTKSLSPNGQKSLEAYNLNKKYMILPLLLVFLFATGLSLGQFANNTSTMENNTTAALNNTTAAVSTFSPENVTIVTNESQLANATIASNATLPGNITGEGNATLAGPNLKFIWAVAGVEADQITMVLDQDGTDLFGQAKYEPQGGMAWNAEVTGAIAGDKVDLTITAQKDNELVSSKLSGILDNLNGTIQGNYTQTSLGKIINKGIFNAMQISPDTSSYISATIEEPMVAADAPAAVDASADAATAPSETETAEKPKSRFVDVREYADKMGPGGDLSGIPPGMSGL